MISMHSQAETITAIEKNPAAHLLAQKNVALNKKADNIKLLLGDGRDGCSNIDGAF